MGKHTRHVLVPLAVLLLLTAMAVQPATMAASEPPPFGCPESWREVQPPVNWVIQCLPTDLAVEGNTGRSGTPSFVTTALIEGVVTPPNAPGVGIDLQGVIVPDRDHVCVIVFRKDMGGTTSETVCFEVPAE